MDETKLELGDWPYVFLGALLAVGAWVMWIVLWALVREVV